jgi:NADH-quinone oxidoreductase subunit L
MISLLWLIPALPLAGFLVLALFGGRFTRQQVAWVGCGSVGTAAFTTALVGREFFQGFPDRESYHQTLWNWIDTSGLTVGVSWYLDALSLLMVAVITGIGFLIHLYSAEYMSDDDGYARFFAYMNLFVAAMLTLVLADNLLLLYLGWEGVGLCSYLLIGFWYREPEYGTAAQKAFFVTRIGDTAFAIGLFILFTQLKSLSIQQVQSLATEAWPVGSNLAAIVAVLFLIGAVGKSAQLPLQVWLPDAMAGPTPVSALIHAATMVTAGVYLIARMHHLFALAPLVQEVIAVIGLATLLLAATSALVQHDIKRVLAYSTMSQIGYMFLALGVGAWSAALFHFLTHSCFKALLFLAAGSVIRSLHHEQNIFRMGGLRRHLPWTFWTFLIGAAAMSGVPLITSGFYSKDWILWSVWSSPLSHRWIWFGALLGAMLTGLYSFRLVFRVFFGEVRTQPTGEPGLAMRVPLVVLAFLALTVGFLEIPHKLGNVTLFSHYLSHALPTMELLPGMDASSEAREQLAVTVSALLGIGLAALLFLPGSNFSGRGADLSTGRLLVTLLQGGWGFDRLYDRVCVRPWFLLTRNPGELLDRGYEWLAIGAESCHGWMSHTQTGHVRWYAATIVVGTLMLLGLFAM